VVLLLNDIHWADPCSLDVPASIANDLNNEGLVLIGTCNETSGRLNKYGVISPRFDVTQDEIEKWVVNLLPSRQFRRILLSTTYGIMTHEEACRKKTGGKILGFFN
jgi:predicted ATPase